MGTKEENKSRDERVADAQLAAHKISQLLLGDTGVYIAPSRLQPFIERNWSDLSIYAHQIHEGEKS